AILLQLEIPLECNLAACRMGRRVILNPAPAAKLPVELLDGLFAITPNEREAEMLTGISAESGDGCRRAAAFLLDRGVERVVITLGERGCYWHDGEREGCVAAPSVEVVDTVAAGDAFNGALAYFGAIGKEWEEALRLATAVASLSVT